jgi:hypothetical protein
MKHIIFLILFVLAFSGYASAYPKFAAYTGEKCGACHLNPTGGGLRTGGVGYSRGKLYMKMFEKVNKKATFKTQLTDEIQIGGDMRMLFVDNQSGEGQPNFNSFFQMQGDLYVNAQINEYLNLLIAPGLYIPNTFGGTGLPIKYEIYGMVGNLPAGLYFKVGRFIPNFGIRVPEHRAYNRDLNGFYTPYAADAGIEVGISPSYFTLTAGLSNGQSKNRQGLLNNSYDFDNQKQITVSGDFRWALESKKKKKGERPLKIFSFGLGGSFINNPFKWDIVEDVNANRKVGAGFFSIGIFERIAILGEIDYNRLERAFRDTTTGIVTTERNDFKTFFGELNAKVIDGVEAKFQFEAYDAELGTKNGETERRRYSFGLVLFPFTGLEIESIVRIVKEPGLDEELKNNEFQTVFHFYY